MAKHGRIKKYSVRGVAIPIVLLVLSLLGLISFFLFTVILKNLNIVSSASRQLSTFEAAEGGIDFALVEIENSAQKGEVVQSKSFSISNKKIRTSVAPLFSGAIEGSNIAFGSGSEGIGGGASGGGVAKFYIVQSDAEGSMGEKASIEGVYRKVIGIQSR